MYIFLKLENEDRLFGSMQWSMRSEPYFKFVNRLFVEILNGKVKRSNSVFVIKKFQNFEMI